MKTISACNIAMLLTLIFTISSCGAPPTTSQLHLLGASSQRIPMTEVPAGMVRIVIYTIPSHQDPPTPTADEEQLATAEMFRLEHRHHCYGSYITKGAMLTAKHCMEFPQNLAMIKLMFSSGEILHLTPPHPTSTSTFTFTSILHPTADLALVIFNAQALQSPPPTIQLALSPDNDHQRPPLYTEAVVYSSAGTDEHLNYPDDSGIYSITSQIRVARGLYVINPHHPEGLDYLCRIDPHPVAQLGFKLFYKKDKCSLDIPENLEKTTSNRHGGWRFIPNFLRSLLDYDEDHLDKEHQTLSPAPNYGVMGPVLIVTAHLRAPDMSLTTPIPREILFCPGDCGGALLNSSGKLIGMIVGNFALNTEHINHGDTSFAFDPIATKKIGCRHFAFAVDIHEHKHWIETTLRSAL